MASKKMTRRQRIHKRIRKRVLGTVDRPRLCVYRSNSPIYAQLVDDIAGHTLVAASSKEVAATDKPATKIDKAFLVGQLIAKKALDAGIKTVTFDRGGYLYHGRIKALAEGARGEKQEDGTNSLLQF